MNLMNRYRLLVFTALLPGSLTVFSQEMWGTALGNYAGTGGVRLNPSAMHHSKSYLDVQLLGLGFFLQNNYLYLSKEDYRFTNFFKGGYEWPSHQEDYGVEERIFYRYPSRFHKNAFIQNRIDGPGAMLVWDRHAVALTTALRSVSSMTHIPDDLANFIYLGLNYIPQQDIRYTDYGPIRASAMSWGEIGLSYSYIVHARGFHRLAAGITLRRLLGLGGAYVHASYLQYVVPDDSTIDIRNLDATLGVALPLDYNDNTALTSPLFKGGGFGLDAGVTYTRLARWHQEEYYGSLCARPYEDYHWRLGLAFIDIGGIRFRNNAVKMRIDNRPSYWEDVNSLNITSVGQLLDTISYKFYGDNTSAYAGDRFTLWLPTALSMQFDYHLRPNIYLNASLVQGIPMARGAIVRPSELTVTPRYESRWFEAGLPVSLYNWQLLRIGLEVRILGLTLGTEKLGGFFHMSDFTGLDFYASLKFFLDRGSCRAKGPVHCGADDENYRTR